LACGTLNLICTLYLTFGICLKFLAEIEDHLNVTIQQVEPDIKVPMDKFDGKVTYGQKRLQTGGFVRIHRPVILKYSHWLFL
jgi:hypothetical protein